MVAGQSWGGNVVLSLAARYADIAVAEAAGIAVAEAARLLPDAEVAEYAGAHHDLHAQHPAPCVRP